MLALALGLVLPLALAPAAGTAAPATTGAVTRAAGAPAIPPLPARWLSVSARGGALRVESRETATGGATLLEQLPRGGGEAEVVYASDAALDHRRDLALVAICCEPSSGSLWAFDLGLRPPQPASAPFDQGLRVESSRGPVARVDTFGVFELRPRFPRIAGRRVDAEAAASDVAIAPNGARTVLLVDPERLTALTGRTFATDVRALRILPANGSGPGRSIALADRVCEIVYLSRGRIGLLRGDFDRDGPLECTGRSLDVVQLPAGTLVRDVVRFNAPIRHVSVDESGRLLLLVRSDGRVSWRDVERNAGGFLDESRSVQAADW